MPNFLGQHFLKNNAVIEKIIAAIDPQAGETIIEIGPGHGELTVPLARVCEKVGARVIAVEKDKTLGEALISKTGGGEKASLPIEIVSGDALTFLKNAATPAVPFKIVGNIPYYLTGRLLRIISELDTKPQKAVFMIQKEVAERICAVPPQMNRLAASLQFWAKPQIIAQVPRTDFSPPPEVESAVIELETRKRGKKSGSPHDLKDTKQYIEQYYATVRVLFAQPRKTILNNLANLASGKSKSEITAALASISIDPALRPQNLSIDDIILISETI